MAVSLDLFDLALLNLVQHDNLRTSAELAEEVGLSPTSVQRRMKRLRQEGVIEADVSIVSTGALGRDMTMIVEVELERESAHLLDTFKQVMRDAPEVMQCYYTTGLADFILIVTAKDMHDYDVFIRRFFYANPNVRRFRTSIVIDRVKVGLTLPITTSTEDT